MAQIRLKKQKKRHFFKVVLSLSVVILSVQTIRYITKANQEPAFQGYTASDKNITPKVKNTIHAFSILQNPELPTGCEATAGTILLNTYGYTADKTELASLLKKSERIEQNGRIYAAHPAEAFIGNPESAYGYGTFPKVLADAVQTIIDRQDGIHKAKPLQGLSQADILSYIDSGAPVCVWTSSYDREIEHRTGWYLIKNGAFSDEYFEWPSNEHVVVLTAYDDSTVTVCDPLVGTTTYSSLSFFRHYTQVGQYALVLEHN